MRGILKPTAKHPTKRRKKMFRVFITATATSAFALFLSTIIAFIIPTLSNSVAYILTALVIISASGVIGAIIGARWDNRYLASDKFKSTLI
jgi:uncharacterized membrane protein YfcA